MGAASVVFELLDDANAFIAKAGSKEDAIRLIGLVLATPVVTEKVGPVVEVEAPKPKRAPRAARPKVEKAPKAEGDKRPRASAEEVQQRKDAALAKATEHFGAGGTWFSLGQLCDAAGFEVESRTMALLVKDEKLEKRGERKETRYQVKP